MSNLRKMEDLIAQYESIEEWQAYCEAQIKQITILSKKIQEVEATNRQLERELLAERAKKAEEASGFSNIQTNLIKKQDIEIIAEIQVRKLKEISFDRELTLDEAKRCEIFNKILVSNAQKVKDVEADGKSLSNEELLKALSSDLLVLPSGNTSRQ